MRKSILVFLSAAVAHAAIQGVNVTEFTATQAILKYQAPDGAPCTVEVSENPSYLPLVNDVDPLKFASAPSDARPGNVEAGGERSFVIGKRAAEIGIDGVRYSRALQAFTTHFYRITCPSTGDTSTGTFATMNIPFGATYMEAEPGDRKKPGALAQPSISLDNRNDQVVDPQTGMLLKRLSTGKDIFVALNGLPLTIARSSAWQNLGNLGQRDGQTATIAASIGPLFLSVKTGPPGGAPYTERASPGATAYDGVLKMGWGYFQAHLIASVNSGGQVPANPDDAKLVACLTTDGVNCYDSANQYEVALGTAAADIFFGSTVSGDLWQKTGLGTPDWSKQLTRNGQSMCDGSPNVSYAGGDLYGTNWTAGSAIRINNADYTIASVTHTATLVLTSNCPSTFSGTGAFDANSQIFRTATDSFAPTDVGRAFFIKGAAGGGFDFVTSISQYFDARSVATRDFPPVRGVSAPYGFPVQHAGTNFGVLIHKKTASADTISVDYAYVNAELNLYNNFTTGNAKLCSDHTVPGPTGRPGYNCQVPEGNLYWVDQDSGEAHLFANMSTTPNLGCYSLEGQMFDAADPDKFWCSAYGPLYFVKYYGNHLEPLATSANGGIRLDTSVPYCNTSASNTPPYLNQQPCISTSSITPGTDIPTLVTAFTANPLYPPQFDKVKFGFTSFKDIDENGNMTISYSRAGSYSIAWVIVFNPTATSNSEGGTSTGPPGNFGCLGGGLPGCVVAATSGWNRPGCRWCTYKDGASPYPGWNYAATYGWTNAQPGSGPYYVQVIDGTANGTGNSLDDNRSLLACPPNYLGATGNRCSRLTVLSEPLSPAHGSGETGLPGELGPAQIGDRFSIQYTLPISDLEQMTLIKKDPGAVAGTWVYTLLRDVNHTLPVDGRSTTGPNPALYTVCNAAQNPAGSSPGYSWMWDFNDDPHGMNANGLTIPLDYTSFNGHSFWSRGNHVVVEIPSLDPRCFLQQCYGVSVGLNRPFLDVLSQPQMTAMVSAAPLWAGGAGAVDASNLQSHPSSGGSAGTADRIPYFLDGRPYRGGYASGSNTGSGSNPATVVAGQLYKFPAASMPNLELPFRKIYPTAAFTGHFPLVDVSSAAQGDVIGTDTSSSYKYCVAAVAGECRAISAIGDVFVNAPYVRYPFCFQAAQNLNLSDEQDICISGSLSVRDAIVQTGMTDSDLTGRTTRILTKFIAPRRMSVFWTAIAVPNGKWMIFESQFPGDGTANKALMLGKIPPPGQQDGIDRTTFVPITLRIPAHPGATAYVRFGYSENGDPGTFYCTSRSENCVAVAASASTWDKANPFSFEQVEKQRYQPVSCDAGCSIAIPGIPQRVMYYQVIFTDSSGNTTQTPMLTTVVP